jgi:hypothetical protein
MECKRKNDSFVCKDKAGFAHYKNENIQLGTNTLLKDLVIPVKPDFRHYEIDTSRL